MNEHERGKNANKAENMTKRSEYESHTWVDQCNETDTQPALQSSRWVYVCACNVYVWCMCGQLHFKKSFGCAFDPAKTYARTQTQWHACPKTPRLRLGSMCFAVRCVQCAPNICYSKFINFHVNVHNSIEWCTLCRLRVVRAAKTQSQHNLRFDLGDTVCVLCVEQPCMRPPSWTILKCSSNCFNWIRACERSAASSSSSSSSPSSPSPSSPSFPSWGESKTAMPTSQVHFSYSKFC